MTIYDNIDTDDDNTNDNSNSDSNNNLVSGQYIFAYNILEILKALKFTN